MAAYQTFTTARTTEPDPASLVTQLRAAVDPTVGVQHLAGAATFVLKKATAWTAPQITAAQTVIDSVAAASDQLTAQALIDSMSLYDKARDLTLVDQLNVIRAALPTPLGAITPAQALTAIRTKAGTL
jgi:hypothetical protein